MVGVGSGEASLPFGSIVTDGLGWLVETAVGVRLASGTVVYVAVTWTDGWTISESKDGSEGFTDG